MAFWRQEKTRNEDNNRINIILAIIFLVGGGIIFKLFSLQVLDYDLYIAKANNQHYVRTTIEAERGRIFIGDGKASTDELYPLATNKKYALLFAVPKDVEEPEEISEILYNFFKQEGVIKEVDEFLKKEDKDNLAYELSKYRDWPEEERKVKEAEVRAEEERLRQTKEWQAARQARIEAEIEKRKKSLIIDYKNVFSKVDDPYEPLEQKVEEDDLVRFYAAVLSLSGAEVKTDDLYIKNDYIYHKSNNGKKDEEAKIPGMDFFLKTYRFYPEKNIGSNMLGFVSYAGEESRGQYGLEGFFNEELTGVSGFLKTEKSAGGELVIVNDREYTKPKNGADLILTIDRTIEYEACTRLSAAVLRHGADSGSVIIMDPKTGAILAMCSAPDYDPNNYREVKDINVYNNLAVFSQYEPGSIFKAVTMAMAVDQEKVTAETTYNDTGRVTIAGYNIENSDHKANGVQTMTNVLEKSLNTGVIFAMRKIGPDKFSEYVKNFGFGEKTGIEMEGESTGDIKNLAKAKKTNELYAATASFGQGIAVTPIQMVSAFGAIANGGILMKPYIVKEVVANDGTRTRAEPRQIRRVITDRTAMILGGMLVNVVENGHGQRAGVPGYYVGGKTGTAQVPKKDGPGYEEGAHIGSFAGFAPVNDPKFVMLVRIDNPRDVEWAESSAAPLFGEIAEFLLHYWQIPTERDVIKNKR